MGNDVGKKIRVKKMISQCCNVILPIDHGLTCGPINGLHPINKIGELLNIKPLNAFIAHRGIVEQLIRIDAIPVSIGIIVHLNGMPDLGISKNKKILLTSIKSAVQHGADAISFQLTFDETNCNENMTLLAQLTQEAAEYGLPTLVMLYLSDYFKQDYLSITRTLLRVCCELSVDMIKLGAPNHSTEIPRLIDGFAENIHIFFAGGALSHNDKIIEYTEVSLRYGAKGVCIGRNIFQNKSNYKLFEYFKSLG